VESFSLPLAEIEDRRFLLRLAQKGDKAAFEKLFAPYLPKLYNLAYHLLAHREDAADAVQDTAIKAFRSLKGFREEADLGTWLARILKNTVLDEVKRAVRRHEEATDVLPERVEHLIEPALERLELKGVMMELLGELSDKLREPIILYDLEGFSYEEMSLILDINLGTVKSRLNRGRLALRDRILAHPERLAGYLPPQLAKSLSAENR
jgi:RNA polymerase sigma-70 factor (ECF subfamily)